MQFPEDGLVEKIKANWENYRVESALVVLSVLTLFTALGLTFMQYSQFKGRQKITFDKRPQGPSKDEIASGKTIFVDISGAIEKPDLYELKAGSRLKDLLVEANGLAKSADREFFQRNFNLARVLADQEKVYIPSKEEVKEGLFKESVFVLAGETTSFSANSTGSVAGASEATDLVNVNTAAKSDLETLPGIGPVTADKIIEGRPYSSIQGLMDEKVVNKGQWEKIKDKITI